MNESGSQNSQFPEIKDIEEVGFCNSTEQRKNSCICDNSHNLKFCWYCDQKLVNIIPNNNEMSFKDFNNLTPQETNSISQQHTTPPSPRQRASSSPVTPSLQSLTRRRTRTTKDEETPTNEVLNTETVSENPPVSETKTNFTSPEKIQSTDLKKSHSEEPLFKGAPPRTIQRVDKKKITAIFSEEEVAKHNTAEDCWMIIKGGVYDITAYFPIHPGGTRALLKFAGKDGTENVQFHSANMMKILDAYFYIGKLKGAKEGGGCILM